jgi:hypothetical protein
LADVTRLRIFEATSATVEIYAAITEAVPWPDS